MPRLPFFGDPEQRRRERQQSDLDANYYQRQKAYNQAKEEQRIKNARQRGIQDANKLANRKPFHVKLLGAGKAVMNDLTTGNPEKMFGGFGAGNPEVFFSWDKPKRKAKRRRKK